MQILQEQKFAAGMTKNGLFRASLGIFKVFLDWPSDADLLRQRVFFWARLRALITTSVYIPTHIQGFYFVRWFAVAAFIVNATSCAQPTVMSLASFRQHTIGVWCFYNPLISRDYKLIIGSTENYIAYSKKNNSGRAWKLIGKGNVWYGRGNYKDGVNSYFYMHLSGIAVNISVDMGTPIPQIEKTLPIWFVNRGGYLELEKATHDCT